MELKDLTIDKLKSDRSDLVAVIAKEAVGTHVAIEAKIAESLKDIPVALKTELFTTLVREAVVAGDDKKLTALIADRKAITVGTKEETKLEEKTQVESAPPAKQTPPAAKKLDRNELVAAAKKR